MHSSKERLVNELNRTNNQTLTTSDIGFANPGATGSGLQTRLTAVALSTGSVSSAGQAAVLYNRMDLETTFNLVGHTLSVMVGDSIQAILPSIRRYTGLLIDAVDVVDTPINWVDGHASVEIQATPNSLSWVGSTPLTLTLTPLELSSVFRSPSVDMSDIGYITQAGLFARELRVNGGYVPLSAVDFGTPRAVEGTYNTEITVTAKANTGYVGTVTFAYNRRDFISVFGDGLDVKNDTVTSWDLVPYFVAMKGDIITVDDITNQAIDYSVIPSYFDLTANPTSLTYVGTSRIDVRRRQDYANTITINITDTNEAFSQSAFEQAILEQSDGNPNVDVYVNIAKDIYLVGDTTTVPTLTFGTVGPLTGIQWYLHNEGTVYGRGGNSPDPTGWADKTAMPGGDGADAVFITNGAVVEITNLGRLVGGGGAGGSIKGTLGNSRQGAGGVPLGLGLTNASVYTTQSNQTTVAYQDPALTTSFVYPYGGGGGEWGMPGEIGHLYYDNSDKVASTASNPGKGVNGDITNLTWVEEGILVPMQVRLPAYFDSIPRAQTISGYTVDPASVKKNVVFYNTVNNVPMKTSMLAKALDLRLADGTGWFGKSINGIDSSWLLMGLDTKLLMVAYAPIYGSTAAVQINWDSLYAAGAVYGTDDEGISPGAVPVLQNARVMVGTDIWRVRLLQGDTVDPVTTLITTRQDSEWNRLIYPMSTTVLPADKFAKFTGASIATALGPTFLQFTQNLTADRINRLHRGGADLSTYAAAASDVRAINRAWKPVLEYVGPGPGDSEYQRFLTWVATQSAVVDQRSVQAGISLPAWIQVGISGSRVLVKVNDQSTAFIASMYGSPYGNLCHANRSYADNMMPHLIAEGAAYAECVASGRTIMVLSASEGVAANVNVVITYNGYNSNVNTTYKDILWRFTEVVYFNALTNRMMVWNPNTKSTPTEFIFWTGAKQDLGAVITNRTLGTLPKDTTDQNFIAKVAAITGSGLYDGHVVFSKPVAYTGSEGNRKVTITAINGGQYTGSVDVYFTRPADTVGVSVPAQFQYPLSVAYTGTVRAYVRRYHPAMHATYFANRASADWDTNTLSVTPYSAPPSFDVRFGSDYVGYEISHITVNPNQTNWWGANTLAAWDAAMFNASGFNDGLGHAMRVVQKAWAVGSGSAAKSTQPNPVFSGAVALYGGGVTVPAGIIKGADLMASWTMDMWYYNTSQNVITNKLPIYITSTVDIAAAENANRILIGSASTNTGKIAACNLTASPGIFGDLYTVMLNAGWSHLAITYDSVAGSIKMYNNGVLFTTFAMKLANLPDTWETGVLGYVFGGTVPNLEIERWRFRSGIQFSDGFDPNGLYAQTYTQKALNTLVRKTTIGTPPANLTTLGFLKNLDTTEILDPRFITVSAVTAYTGPEGNSKVTLTAVSGGLYTGSVDIYFTRIRIGKAAAPAGIWRFASSAVISALSPFTYLKTYFPDVANTYFPNNQESDFALTPTVSFAVNTLTAHSITLVPVDAYRYLPENPMVVNPANANWEGADLVLGFDAQSYVQAGWTDKAGNTLRGYNNYAGNAGAYPVIGSNGFGLGKGIGLNKSMVASVNTLPATTFSEPFTIDMWVQFAAGAPTSGSTLPLSFVLAQPNTSAFTATDRFQISADATSNGFAIWNNATNPLQSVTPNAVIARASWHHLAVTYDGSVARFYQDGVLFMTSGAFSVTGKAWQFSVFGPLQSNNYPVLERYRIRKGVKFTPAGFKAADLYPTS